MKKKCSELGDVDLIEGTQISQGVRDVKDRAAELMQTDVRKRMEELKQMRESLPETVEEGRKKSIAEALRRMMPGTTAEIAAMKTVARS